MKNWVLFGRRILLRPITLSDYGQWAEVRTRNGEWLTKWEPTKPAGLPNFIGDRSAFALRCNARERDWNLDIAYSFGIFLDGNFIGEINMNSVQRGPFQSAYVGYWIDKKHAGNGYVPESLVLTLQFAFEEKKLHRMQVSMLPRNESSIRVVEKLGLRNEGLAQSYLEINGVWEDHYRYAMLEEEWFTRRDELLAAWL